MNPRGKTLRIQLYRVFPTPPPSLPQCCYLATVCFSLSDSPCVEFKAPKNGAKACETWLAGMICTVHCNEGYGFAEYQPPTYHCSPTTGMWFPGGVKNLVVPDCSSKKKEFFLINLKRCAARF